MNNLEKKHIPVNIIKKIRYLDQKKTYSGMDSILKFFKYRKK